jgi:hypothetical protein
MKKNSHAEWAKEEVGKYFNVLYNPDCHPFCPEHMVAYHLLEKAHGRGHIKVRQFNQSLINRRATAKKNATKEEYESWPKPYSAVNLQDLEKFHPPPPHRT